jgi:hypothetical protein
MEPVRTHAQANAATGPLRDRTPAIGRDPLAAAGNMAMQALLRGGLVRAKLTVGGRDDPEEREADATADRIMRSADTSCCASCGNGGNCEDDTARRKPDGAGAATMSRGAEAQIRSLGGGGETLSLHLRAFFEPRLDRDLSDVRVHRDGAAADSARGIGARAYTLGSDIAFASGQWQPDTNSGRHLIAHELAHVAQNGAAVRRAPDNQSAQGAQATGPQAQQGQASLAGDVNLGAIDDFLAVADSTAGSLVMWTLLPGGTTDALRAARPLIALAVDIYRNPDPYIERLKAFLLSKVLAASDKAVETAMGAAPKTPAFNGPACVWRHLENKLLTLKDEWWEVLKAMGSDLIWPWPGVATDFSAIWSELKLLWGNLKNLEFSRAVDNVLAVLRHLNSAAGRLYGWFLLGSVFVGAVLGAIGGAAAGGVGAAPGALAGAGAGLALAGEVGYGLLIATLAIEFSSILKASANLAGDRRSPSEKECDCEVIASSSLTIGISLLLAFLGSLAGKFAKSIVQRAFARIKTPTGTVDIWDPSLVRRPGGRPESRGDILEARLSMAEMARVVFRRYRVAITDNLTVRDNFPGIDLTERSTINMTNQTTGQPIGDVQALNQAFTNGQRVRINVDGGDVFQVKSHGARAATPGGPTSSQLNLADITREIGDLSNFNSGNITFTRGGPHPVTLTNIASRTLVVFLQEGLAPADEAAARAAATASNVNLQLVTGAVPPGHPAMIAWDALPGALMELGQSGVRATTETQQRQQRQPVECPP